MRLGSRASEKEYFVLPRWQLRAAGQMKPRGRPQLELHLVIRKIELGRAGRAGFDQEPKCDCGGRLESR